MPLDPERLRLAEAGRVPWRRWGPYLAERAWGTVREDYSAGGDAWSYLPHDHARSRVYRWGEDGMAGICDDGQLLCLALALWNGRDPILKERMFGLSGPEGNHGEDAKEYWWFCDATPTASYLRWRYAYPQAAYPYEDLVEESARRGRLDPEYELLDTGVLDHGYWDVGVEYAKAAPDDICALITVRNAGPALADLDVLPTLWFRNTWVWGHDPRCPQLSAREERILATHHLLGEWTLAGEAGGTLLFCDNESNSRRLWGDPGPPCPKDGINDHVVSGAPTVNPAQTGTKAALRYRLSV
ncbi:MAG: MGH1-like glycoside hydrolase domain-containing protein, partial [Candidatus Dormibacteria bacterium]